MQFIKKFSSLMLVLSLVFFSVMVSFTSKVNAAADVATAGANITSANTIDVYLNNPGHNIASVDFSKFHIDVNTGGVDPLNPVSAVIHTAGNPWIITLTFAGTPFSDTATAYDASHGMYIDALAVTDTNGDTNEVIAHGASIAVNDDQNPVFVSAETTSDTNIAVTFSESVTVVEAGGIDFTFPVHGVVVTAAAIDGDDNTIVNLTTNPLGNDFNSVYPEGLDIAADAVRDVSGYTNANLASIDNDVEDGISPETPTINPTHGVRVNALPQTTTISSVGSESIRYTLDGTTPNCSTGLTANPFTLTSDKTVKAIGCDESDNFSSVATFEYIFVNHSGGGSGAVSLPAPALLVTPIALSEIIAIPISAPIVSNIIEGCENRTTGFSTTTGKSCVGNTGASPATPIIKYNFGNSILKNGSRGEAVKELQRFLNQVLNLGLVVDGRLGPKTIAVIKKWQKDNGLVSDGLIGPKTKEKMLGSIN